MRSVELGQSALVGWRGKVAEGVAAPISARTRLSAEQVEALVGGVFFALGVYYVAGTIARVLKRARE